MRLSWIVATGYGLDPSIDIDKIKNIGSIWGSWQTWRGCQTDNVICHDLTKCRELMARAFQAVCNFYVPKNLYQELNRPIGVKLYEGDFHDDVYNIEDIIAGHLAAQYSDVVLMLGFDLSTQDASPDRMINHRNQNRHGLLRSMIGANINVQWVLVDPINNLDASYLELANLTCDTMDNVLQLLL